jgi:delta 1-pyrroline-5-carboxylate dehydrogenase
MSAVISLPHQLYERLAQKSQQLNRTPEAVVTDLVQTFLNEADEQWQAEFQALIAQVQARTAVHPADEIEADITVAAAEARELRRARRAA